MKKGHLVYWSILLCITLLTNNIVCYSDEYFSEGQYDSLASKFYKSEMVCVYDSIAGQYIKNMSSTRTIESFTQNLEYTILQDSHNETYIEKILIIVKENVYAAIPQYVIRYAHDIHNAYGCAVNIVSVNGETPPQLKSIIQIYSSDLSGVVLIGDIAPAIYYHAAMSTGLTDWEEDYFPCDLFYMDLDGIWHLKDDGSGMYDDHTGDVRPEIFVGRINTATMGRNEIYELQFFFDKDHQYWTGKKTLNKQRALSFTGPDWDELDFWNSVSPLYGNSYYDIVRGNQFTRSNYVDYIQNSNYEFIQLACHSNSKKHAFDTLHLASSDLYYYQISLISTKQIGYNLFCCKACNWMSDSRSQCLGESYLYGQSNNSSALALVGSTKSGGMLGFSSFYNALGNGICIGTSYWLWWLFHCGSSHTPSHKLWFYGMTILGDPLVNFNFTNECDNYLYLYGGEENGNKMYYAQNGIVVQNYSLTHGQNVTLSAPNIHITGNFCCTTGSLSTNIKDRCICNISKSLEELKQDESFEKLVSSPIVKPTSSFLVSIYPNPVKDILSVDANQEIKEITLYNFQGQCLLRRNESEIKVSDIPLGIYVIRVFSMDGEIYESKIIIEK